MNKSVVLVVILAVVSLSAGVLVGMNIPARGMHTAGYPGFHMKGKGARGLHKFGEGKERANILASISKRLSLSEEQKEKIKAILESSRQEVQQVGKDSMQQMAQIKQATNAKIREVLNSKQQEEFDKMIAEMKERLEKRKATGGRGEFMPGVR
jgi:Spy/CpxP family protein refolding chaperone